MMRNHRKSAVKTSSVAHLARVVAAAALLVLFSSGWGCTPEIQQPPPRPDNQQESVAEHEEFQGFQEMDDYSRPDYPVRRNPFRPDPEALGMDETEEIDEDLGPTDPLEEYALSSLRLASIMSETTVPKAMFIDPTGLGHFAKEGDRIGRRGGVIRSIRTNEVEIREGEGTAANMVTVRLRDQDPVRAAEQLTEEEREALRRLLESEEGREVLEEVGTADSAGQRPPEDERFPGLRPPDRR